jgi:hypothetical protein
MYEGSELPLGVLAFSSEYYYLFRINGLNGLEFNYIAILAKGVGR